MRQRHDTYPRHLANRLEPGVGYDVLFVPDLDGAIAVRSADGVLDATLRAAGRAGRDVARGPREVSAADLPGVAPRLLWVNPTAADLLRLGWSSPPGLAMCARAHTASTDGSAASQGDAPIPRGLATAA